MRPTALVLLLAVFCIGTDATRNNNNFGFTIDSLLVCEVPNPVRGRGQPSTKPEAVPTIPLVPQAGDVLGCLRIAGFPFHVAESMKICWLGLLVLILTLNSVPLMTPTANPPMDCPAFRSESGAGFTSFTADPDVPAIPEEALPFLNSPAEIAGAELFILALGLDICPIERIWTELPETYFPPYFAQGVCSGNNCSFPRGLTCEPDLSGPQGFALITVLRWDCCWNFASQQWRWDCGWRKVQIPILCDCRCDCSAALGK